MLAIVTLLLGMFTSYDNPSNLTARNLNGMLPIVATLALVAYSQQIVMLVGGIDISVGPLVELVPVIASSFLTSACRAPKHILSYYSSSLFCPFHPHSMI